MQVQIIFNNNKEGIYPFINIGYLRRITWELTYSGQKLKKMCTQNSGQPKSIFQCKLLYQFIPHTIHNKPTYRFSIYFGFHVLPYSFYSSWA